MMLRFLLTGLLSLAAPLFFTTAVAAPDSEALPKQISADKPWYSFRQLSQGAKVFSNYCAACHGGRAEGTADWRQRGPDGRYPAPPLDGSAHTWHHSLPQLFGTVKFGTQRLGGSMPAWGERLTDEEIVAVLAWVQSRWPKQTWRVWAERFGQP